MDILGIRLQLYPDSSSATQYMVAELFVNDVPLADFSYFATDLNELLASTEKDGEFFILTCWCGVPGCAGLGQGIKVRREPKVVYWRMLEPKPERSFVFEREAYDVTIQKIAKTCKRWSWEQRFTNKSVKAIEVTPDSNSSFFE
jgi:hypothetical protein